MCLFKLESSFSPSSSSVLLPWRNARQEAASCESPCARLEPADRTRLVCAAFLSASGQP